VAQEPATSQQPIIINSAFSNIDYRTNTAAFKDIVVSQGDTRVTAERASATGVGFTNSQWTFAGGVVMIWEPRGTLRADQVIMQFSNGEVTEGTATGSPAYFEQRRTDSDRPVHGHADRITYDAKHDTVHLYGHAQLSDGRKEMSAPVLMYSFRDESWQAEGQDERREVHITITPPK
jgi:lipopolysaccharide transport protein LptA